MTKLLRFFEIGYLIIAIVLAYETFSSWDSSREKAYIYLAFSIAAIFMYFFKKRFRKKTEARNKNQ